MLKNLTISGGVFALTVVLIPQPSQAAVIYEATGDTYVQQGNADTALGSTDSARVRMKNTNTETTERLTFLKFDMSTLTDPTGAILTLDSISSPSGTFDFRVYGIDDGQGDEDFNELTLTFNNSNHTKASVGLGSADPTDDGFDEDSAVSLLGTVSVTDGDDMVFSGPALETFLTDTVINGANSLASFIIVRDTVDGSVTHSFSSKEGVGSAPTITVIPEPASLALVISGAALMVCRRRR